MGHFGTNYVAARTESILRGTLSKREVLHSVAVVVLLLVAELEGQVAQPVSQMSGNQSPSLVTLKLEDALTRAKANSPQFQAALMQLGLASEDRVQARAALLPEVNYTNSFIYTQGNGSTGVYIANNGVHEYISQGVAHEVLGFGSVPDYQRAKAAQALAKARAQITARGLVVTVVQAFYGLLAGQEKTLNTARATDEAQHFLDLSKKLEAGGEVAHSDVIKAQIQANDAQRQLQDTKLAEQNARLALAVLLFPNFFQDFALVNDLAALPSLPAQSQVEQLAMTNNPELHAALSALAVANKEVAVARARHLPSLTVDMFYGIDANQFATEDRNGLRNLGYAGAAILNIPIFSWGATQSKVKQAELQRHQAQVELSAAQRQALADFQSFYAEAHTALGQIDTLHSSADLAAESLRLTNLRYQAGEATALEVVDAQNTLTMARNAYHDGEVRYRLSLANLQTLTGTF
jgi:outer membrane protein